MVLGKQRKTTVEVVTVVAGYYEVLERDAKGRPTRQKWIPQTQKAANGTLTPITVQVPIEEQFNNGRGLDYYRRKGYLPLDEAEEKLLRDYPEVKFTPRGEAPIKPAAAEPVDPNALTPKVKVADPTNKPRRKR